MSTLGPAPIKDPWGSFTWEDWFRQLRKLVLSSGGTGTWSGIDFSGSKLTDIASRPHNNLQAIQGGGLNEYYHLTATEYLALSGGTVVSWTPTASPSSGSFTSADMIEYSCYKIGPLYHCTFTVSITTNGTAAGVIDVTLPTTPTLVTTGQAMLGASGVMCSLRTVNGAAVARIWKYDGSYPGADGVNIRCTLDYI